LDLTFLTVVADPKAPIYRCLISRQRLFNDVNHRPGLP
jgi:hypothetical protein